MTTAVVLSIRQVEAAVSLGRSSIYRLSATGDFPASVQLSAGRVGWMADEVAAWIASRPRRGTRQGTRAVESAETAT